MNPLPLTESLIATLLLPPSQVEAMKEVGVAFSGLVQEVAALREAASRGLDSLQEEHGRLEENIRQAQERHQTVRV